MSGDPPYNIMSEMGSFKLCVYEKDHKKICKMLIDHCKSVLSTTKRRLMRDLLTNMMRKPLQILWTRKMTQMKEQKNLERTLCTRTSWNLGFFFM